MEIANVNVRSHKIIYIIPMIFYFLFSSSTKYYFGTNTKSTKLRIHKLVIFNQTTKIDTNEEKYFHSNCFVRVKDMGV
jgi:hypothetical protein